MKAVKIKINSTRISPKINKKKIRWATNFLKNKIKKNIYLNIEKVECILIDYNSLNIEKFKKIYFKNDIEESFSINPIQNNFKKVLIYGNDTRGLVYAITEIDDRIENLSGDIKLLFCIYSLCNISCNTYNCIYSNSLCDSSANNEK